jgi:hypothetical protein
VDANIDPLIGTNQSHPTTRKEGGFMVTPPTAIQRPAFIEA